MSDSLKGNKTFALESVMHNPLMLFLFHCADEDIFLRAATVVEKRRTLWDTFINDLGDDRLVAFLKAIHGRFKSLAFKSFLQCCWKSCRQESCQAHPLRIFDCGPETSTGLKMLIRSFVGQDTEEIMCQIEVILERVASTVLERKELAPDLLPSMPQEVLMTVMNRKLISHSWPEPERCTVPVDNIPVGFWRDREFVLKWVKCYGRMPDVAGSTYKADAEVCLAYYQATDFAVTTLKVPPLALDECIAWFWESLVMDIEFVTGCALINPLILNACSDDDRHRYVDFLIEFACEIARTKDNKTSASLERFAEIALSAGWGKALIKLVKGLRANIVETSNGIKKWFSSDMRQQAVENICRLEMILEHITSIALERSHQLPQDLLKCIPQTVLMADHGRCAALVNHIPSGFWSDREFVMKWLKFYGRMPNVAGSMYKADVEVCLAYYKAADFAMTTFGISSFALCECIAWFSDSLMINKAFVTQCALINPLILDACSDVIRLDADFLIDLACQLVRSPDSITLEHFAGKALIAGWGEEALIRIIKGLRDKVVDRKAFQSFVSVSLQLFSSGGINESTKVMELIESYLGVVRHERFHNVLRIWRDPCIKKHLTKANIIEQNLYLD
jgi:hypothetical protein